MPRASSRRAVATLPKPLTTLPLALLWTSYAISLGCASPDLTRTLFSCATSADCAPGQQCLAFQGELACQFASSSPRDECAQGGCNVPAALTDAAPLLPAVPLENLSAEAPRLDAPLANPGQAGGEAVGVAPPGSEANDRADAGPVTPSVRFDFEADLEGWRMGVNQRPVDTLDTVEQSAALAHHGTGALRMVLDGNYTPTPPPPFGFDAGPYYGIFQAGAPPPGVDVSLWMLSTAPGMSVEVYTQSGATFTWTVLATVPLLPNEWRQITVAMPLEQARQLGIRLYSPLDFAGEVYLDEIRW
jgi:hypothetical protein